MRKFTLTALVTLIAALVIWGADWPTQSGSPQRDGWARAEKAFTRENAGKIELLYKYQAENKARALQALTAPIVNGMLITYLGFKEMLVFGGSSDNVYAIDADLNRKIWTTHFPYNADKPQATPTATCPGGLTASIAMPGSSSAVGGRGFGGPGRGAGRGSLFATGFGRSGVFIAVSGDGYLHALNTSTGGDKVPPVKFLPPNSKAGALNINDSIVYAATQDNCGGSPDAIYALDMSEEAGKLSSFPATTSGGVAIGSDGTVYAQTHDGVKSFTKDLKAKDSFAMPGPGSITPLVFQWKGKDVVAVGGTSVHLLNSASLSEIASTDSVAGGIHGAFASWEDAATNARWIYASSNRGVIAYKVEDHNGAPALTLAWTSNEGASAGSLVTANGLVFALAEGSPPSGHAILHVLDGLTGKDLYSYTAASFAHDGGLAIANRRIYFTDHGNTLYCLGFMADQPQLTGR